MLKEVDGLKYSVHASSILDVDETADQLATLKINARQVGLENNKVIDSYLVELTYVGSLYFG